MEEHSFWNVAKETAQDNLGCCYCRIYRRIVPFICDVEMSSHATESSLFGQLVNPLWNEQHFAITEQKKLALNEAFD